MPRAALLLGTSAPNAPPRVVLAPHCFPLPPLPFALPGGLHAETCSASTFEKVEPSPYLIAYVPFAFASQREVRWSRARGSVGVRDRHGRGRSWKSSEGVRVTSLVVVVVVRRNTEVGGRSRTTKRPKHAREENEQRTTDREREMRTTNGSPLSRPQGSRCRAQGSRP